MSVKHRPRAASHRGTLLEEPAYRPDCVAAGRGLRELAADDARGTHRVVPCQRRRAGPQLFYSGHLRGWTALDERSIALWTRSNEATCSSSSPAAPTSPSPRRSRSPPDRPCECRRRQRDGAPRERWHRRRALPHRDHSADRHAGGQGSAARPAGRGARRARPVGAGRTAVGGRHHVRACVTVVCLALVAACAPGDDSRRWLGEVLEQPSPGAPGSATRTSRPRRTALWS